MLGTSSNWGAVFSLLTEELNEDTQSPYFPLLVSSETISPTPRQNLDP